MNFMRMPPIALRKLALWQRAAGTVLAALLTGAVPLKAEEFVLRSNEILTGRAIAATGSSIMIQLDSVGLVQFGIAEIRELRIATTNKGLVTGKLLGWRDGVYRIRSGQDELVVGAGTPGEAGKVMTAGGDEAASKTPNSPPPVAAIPEVAPPAVQPSLEVAPSSETQEAVEPVDPIVTVSVTSSRAREDDGELVLVFELSQPSTQPLVMIYASIDGAAVAGSDYQPTRDVLTLQPGEMRAEVRIGLIDDDLPEVEEDLQLFVTVDPNVARLSHHPVVVMIDDDD